jgi:hypothetical protein
MTCEVADLVVEPFSSASVGTKVRVYARGVCSGEEKNVRAMRVKIYSRDTGKEVRHYEIGSSKLEYFWDTSGFSIGGYKVVIHVAAHGDNSWSHIGKRVQWYELKSAKPEAPKAIDSFGDRDIIKIGDDIFVIWRGQRRLVPNSDTLDALGITRSEINNKGFSDHELLDIPQGRDIPDVNREYTAFMDFKNMVFPGREPIRPAVDTPVPDVSESSSDDSVLESEGIDDSSEPDEETSPEDSEEIVGSTEESEEQVISEANESQPTNKSFLCTVFPLFCPSEVLAANLSCSPQCVTEARRNRPDIWEWSDGGTSVNILKDAGNEKIFNWHDQEMQVRVRGSGEQPESGDLVVWPSGCTGAWNGGGHIGYVVSSSGGNIVIVDSNWGTPDSTAVCSKRVNVEIKVEPCMKFITSPYIVGDKTEDDATITSSDQPIDVCNQYRGLRRFLCKWLGWK